MDPSETERQSFIVRIKIEEATLAQPHPLWRGSILHVPGGERLVLHSLDDIAHFIAPYLEQMGVDLGTGWRIRRTLANWRKRLRPRGVPTSFDELS